MSKRVAEMTEQRHEQKKAYERAWYQQNRKRVLAARREYEKRPDVRTRRRTSKRRRMTDPAYRKKQQAYVTGWKREKKYGITPEQYAEMLVSQKGVCAICHQPERSRGCKGSIRVLTLDHDHATNEIRGLLCDRCNRGLGYFGDDPQKLAAAITYLKKED